MKARDIIAAAGKASADTLNSIGESATASLIVALIFIGLVVAVVILF